MEYAHAGKPVGYATWQSIYPLYINSKRSLKCGRRLSRESAVENPTIDEILQALTQIGFKNEEIVSLCQQNLEMMKRLGQISLEKDC